MSISIIWASHTVLCRQMGKPRLTQMSGNLTEVTQLNNTCYGWDFGSSGSWLILLPLTDMANGSVENMTGFETRSRAVVPIVLLLILFVCFFICLYLFIYFFAVCLSWLSLSFIICEIGIKTTHGLKWGDFHEKHFVKCKVL